MDSLFRYGKDILPFFEMTPIREGGTAQVYHCKIQADLVGHNLSEVLEPYMMEDAENGNVQFVLKVAWYWI